MSAPHRIRIFLASPQDTAPVRAIVAEVVEALNAGPAWRRRVQIELLHWDNPLQPVPCSFLRNPQHEVLAHTGDPADCDLVIGLFRHRFGSPMPEADWGLSPDGDEWTGTEWELARAIEAAHQGQVRDVLVFRDQTEFRSLPGTPKADAREAWEQFQRVEAFFESCREAGTGAIVRGLNPYDGEATFRQVFQPRLEEWLALELDRRDGVTPSPPPIVPGAETLTPEQRELESILLAGGQPLPDALLGAVYQAPVSGLRGHVLQRAAAWCRPGQGRLHTRFVNLDLLVDHGPGSEGLRFETRQRYDSLPAMLAEHPDAGAWVLVGDPGGGKSTLLQQLELQTATAALRALRDGGPRPALCVWQRLADYPADAPEPQAWLAAQWQRLNPRLPPLAEMAARFHLRFLLDGLNEMPAADAAAYRRAVRRWAAWAAEHPEHRAPVFSVRTLDHSEPLAHAGLAVEQARLARWSDEQVAQYTTLRLGPGNPLEAGLQDERLRELCSLPFNLAAQCDLVLALGRAAQDRAELFGGLAWLRLKRGHERGELDAGKLLAAQDRRQLTDPAWWREHLNDLPAQGTLVPALERQAEAMHRSGQGSEVSVARAEVLPGFAEAERADWIAAVQALHLAEVELGGRFRYTHQLWQEYFAARHLRELPGGSEALPDLHPPALRPLDEVLRDLAAKSPLPGPGASGWEEAVKLALLMSTRPERWLAALRPVNPALAGRGARPLRERLRGSAEGREQLDALRRDLLARAEDRAIDLRQRIEAAEALGWLGDPRYEEAQSPGRPRALLPVRNRWVRVEGGAYTIGSSDGDADERPLTEVELEPFEMAFAPVTNAEYRCFIEAEGYENEDWWVGDTARRWRREGLRNQERFDYWTPRIAALHEDFDAALKRYFEGETEAYIERELRVYAQWSEEQARRNLEFSFGAQVHREPAQWTDPDFNHPSQPVVGICVFEAQAYCRWLSAQTGRTIRLPTEAEWEAAARGPKPMRWPWGKVDPGPWWINADPAHLRRTSPVGVFPDGNTPLGLTDLSGNALEWTSSAYTERLERDALTAEAPDGIARRAVRGGSWSNHAAVCRPGYRLRNSPDNRSSGLGFRVVCCPIQNPEP